MMGLSLGLSLGGIPVAGAGALQKRLLIIAWGESNSGGAVPTNTFAMDYEKSPRSQINWWNVTNEEFESLDLATNNNIDHTGINQSMHSWEIGLLSLIQRGYYDQYDGGVYYVQTGQGGSKVSDWESADTYWTKFVARTTAALAEIEAIGGDWDIVVWGTLGINDAIATVSKATFKAGLSDIFDRIKAQVPGAKIIMTELPAENSYYTDNTAAIQELAAADSSNIASFSVIGVPRLAADVNHYNYTGQKQNAYKFTQKMLEFGYSISSPEIPLVWNAKQIDQVVSFTGTNEHAHVVDVIRKSEFESLTALMGLNSSAFVLVLDTGVNETNFASAGDDYLLGMYYFFNTSGSIEGFYATVASTTNIIGVENASGPLAVWGRIRRDGDDLICGYSIDLGESWTEFHTVTDALAGIDTFRIKALSALNASHSEIWLNATSADVIAYRPMGEVESSCEYDLDFTIEECYPGTGTDVFNLEPTPASAAAQGDYNFQLGTGAAAMPTFSNGEFVFDGASYLRKNPDVYTTFETNMPKTTGGTNFSVVIKGTFYNTGSQQTLLGYKSGTNGVGIYIGISATGFVEFSQRGSSGFGSATTDIEIVDGEEVTIALAYNGSQLLSWKDGTRQADETLTFNTTTSNTTGRGKIGAVNNTPGIFLGNNSKIKALSVFNAALDNTKEAAVRGLYTARHAA